MTARRLLAATAATGALAIAAPALAQPAEPYEYAEPVAEGEVVFRGEPVIQPLPVPPPIAAPVVHQEQRDVVIARPAPGVYAAPPMPHHGYPPPHPMAYGAPPAFDRDAWLLNCRERIRGVSRRERSEVIGGLLGAAAGGVIGNRAWDSEWLAGTLLGAGVGGLAGLAIGSAIGAAGERKREDECAWHLDRYMAGGYPRHGYGHPGYAYGYQGYGYGYPAVAYVPVLVAVPQRAVVRETVTEEWIDAPAPARTVTHTTVVRERAPVGDKRIKYAKGR